MAYIRVICLFITAFFMFQLISNTEELSPFPMRYPRKRYPWRQNLNGNLINRQNLPLDTLRTLRQLSQRRREVQQQNMKTNRTRIRMIEKAFFMAFRKCHLADLTDFVPLDQSSRRQRKECVINHLRNLESSPGEYTRYLNVALDSKYSEVLKEQMDSRRNYDNYQPAMQSRMFNSRPSNDENYKDSKDENKDDYSDENQNDHSNENKEESKEQSEENFRRSGGKYSKYHNKKNSTQDSKEAGTEKPDEEKSEEEKEEKTGIEEIEEIPDFPYISLGDDGKNGTKGLIIFMNFTLPETESFPANNSAIYVSQIMKTFPDTMKFVLEEIRKRKKPQMDIEM